MPSQPGQKPEPNSSLQEQQFGSEWLQVTLSSIGDAVITTDNLGAITFLNPVAETLTGWNLANATGQPLEAVFKIINEHTRQAAENPAVKALREGVVVGLANHTLLVAQDGTEHPIDDSAAPIRNAAGQVAGVVLVFRDVTHRKHEEQLVQDALAYADNILATLREPFLVLDHTLRVVTANEAFYQSFQVTPAETQGQFIYDLGNRQWDIPKLRTLLEDVLPLNQVFQDFEVDHDFSTVGRKIMLLNARRIRRPGKHSELILLAIEDITESRQADILLRHSKTQLRDFVENANVGFHWGELDGTILWANRAEYQLLGYQREEYIGRNIAEFHADASVIQNILARVQGNETLKNQPARLRHKDGSFRHVLISANSYFEHDQFVHTRYFTRDITDRKLAEDALEAAHQRFQFMAESMPQKIFTALPNGEINYFNPQWEVFTGLSFEQIKGVGWHQFIHPDDLEKNIKVWQSSIDTGELFELEHRFRRSDGQYRWHFSRATQMRDGAGKVVMWIGSNTDVHEIKLIELKVQDSEMRYRRLFEAAKDGILILDTSSGKIIDANPFMSDLLGYTHAMFMGKHLWEIGLFGDKSASEAAVKELQEKGYARFEHLPLKSKSGKRVEVEVVANVYRENQQSVIQCNIRDITERSQLEALLRGQTAELSDLHRRKDEFLAMLSHELRSPLAPISNAVQLLGLQRGSESVVQQQARGIIERQLGQLQHLVGDLLEVSRITTGRVQLRQQRVAVATAVNGALETVGPIVDQRRHELVVKLPLEPIWVFADSARLEQVLVNLLTNAAKFTEQGGKVELEVKVEWQESNGSWASSNVNQGKARTTDTSATPLPFVALYVRDSGVGISSVLLPRIFDLFTQGERTLDRSQGGLGIGLALVKRLTELHGGTIEASSILGEGSQFVVRLPILPSDAAAQPLQPTKLEPPPKARSLRVLVVDDNVDTVLSLSMLLTASGHEVQTAHEGTRAVQVALDFLPDVILLDIGLPGLNGFEVAKRIRQETVLKNAVLVALTGYGQESDRQASLEAGFNSHLVKPANFEQLQKILASAARQIQA